MNHFLYRDGALFAEDVAVSDIAAEVGTPFYCYSTATLRHHYRVFEAAFPDLDTRVCYALKANGSLAVVRTFAELGAGADVVSEGELRQALVAGVAADRIVFSGVGKTRDELAFALSAGIGQINVESEPELVALSELATGMGTTAPVALRVNPDIDAETNEKIATGRKGDKFGIDIDRAPELYARAANLPGIEPVGLAIHIGSQLTALEPFRAAFTRLAALTRALRAEGLTVDRLDLGGGLGIVYDGEAPPLPIDYGTMVHEVVGDLDCELVFEPGRVLVGSAGILVTRVIYVKTAARRFVIVDAAMNDFLRPALYGARHRVVPVIEAPADAPRRAVDVVGPVCETADILARDENLPDLAAGDLLSVASAGAYGAVMASTYNMRLPVAEVIVNAGEFFVIRPRPDYDTLLSMDRLPPWLETSDAPESGGAA